MMGDTRKGNMKLIGYFPGGHIFLLKQFKYCPAGRIIQRFKYCVHVNNSTFVYLDKYLNTFLHSKEIFKKIIFCSETAHEPDEWLLEMASGYKCLLLLTPVNTSHH